MARKGGKSSSNKSNAMKQQHTKPGPAVPEIDADDAEQTVRQTPTSKFASLVLLADIRVWRALGLLALAGLCAAVSQLNLGPVYGAIPAGLYHGWGLTASFLLAFVLRTYHLPAKAIITPLCFWIPTIQFVAFRFSGVLGNPFGPVLTECLTCWPVVTLSAYVGMEEVANLDTGDSPWPGMALFVAFVVLQRAARKFVAAITPAASGSFLTSRVGLQLIIASLYGTIVPGSVWVNLPAVAFTMVGNPHTVLSRTTDVLNNTLGLHDYSLLERRESVTGYVSVLEDDRRGIRFLRCDHSLLGGVWKIPPESTSHLVEEPIYAIFTMLEAVRLVKPDPLSESGSSSSSTSTTPTALNIGLGVGTAPSALVAHGVRTTIVEVDPAVHEFAVKYFGLPTNHTSVIGDAVSAVATSTTDHSLLGGPSSYDYILHDVFTGGAEPVELFTLEFLQGLRDLLRPDGVVAINYAGDLAPPSTAPSIIYRTVTSVFHSCRVFREDEPDLSSADDFTNMVFFCKKQQNAPVEFRKPVPADFLGSGARRDFLLPRHEIPPDAFDGSVDVLRSGRTGELRKRQAKSALGHWKVMRTVLPDAIWENW